MTNQRTLTTAHWGVYEVEYDGAGQAVRLHPFSKDPDPSPIGLHMLSEELAGARPRSEQRQKRTRAVHRAAVGRGTRPRGQGTRAREGRTFQPRDLRRLLRLVERRPLPPP